MVEKNQKIIVDAYKHYDIELEDQFILRLPPAPAAALRDVIRSEDSNLEDRLLIKTDPDMRHATVQFDKWTLPAKLFHLPTIIESCKTLDSKIFYKTADICQIMIAEDGDVYNSDKNVPAKKKDKDAKNKRYMYPHGITPPLKNVRKKRFRKTLKKRHADWLNIEKEVKRLLRADADAVSVRYEICDIIDEKAKLKNDEGEFGRDDPLLEKRELNNSQTADVAIYDIFGKILSSSEESGEEYDENFVDVNEKEATRKLQSIHEKQEKVQESYNMKNGKAVSELDKSKQLNLITAEQFPDSEGDDIFSASQIESAAAVENLDLMTKKPKEKMALIEKFHELENTIASYNMKNDKAVAELAKSKQLNLITAEQFPDSEEDDIFSASQIESAAGVENLDLMTKEQKEKMALMEKFHELENTIASLQANRRAYELKIKNMENEALKRRFQANVNHLIQEEYQKQQEYNDIVNILQES